MTISASDVMKLRKATGAGMMDCKKALTEANGDFDEAIKIIREKGKAVAMKRADRDASEGAVLSATNAEGTFGAIVALNCETDFVAMNEDFVAFTKEVLEIGIKNKATNLDELNALKIGAHTIAEIVTEKTGVIGEKIELSAYECVDTECVVSYIHPGNKLATLAGFNKVIDNQVARDIAMQVAAMSPVAIDESGVPQNILDNELEIAKEKFRQEGKPEAMLDQIAQGAVKKFLKESTLVNQPFIKDNKSTVQQYLKSVDNALTVTGMKRVSLD
ncbi:MAG: translation elongation factor Ts [Bacteroidales bacterium]